jgi:hypothetical protein
MGLVEELHVVRHPVDPLPLYGPGHEGRVFHAVGAQATVGQQLDDLGVLQTLGGLAVDRRVAEETLLHGGDGGGGSLGNVPVAELTLDTRLVHVDGVREGDGLVGATRAEPEDGLGPPRRKYIHDHQRGDRRCHQASQGQRQQLPAKLHGH